MSQQRIAPMSPTDSPERYAPEVPFPAYAFVPGMHPHPATDPNGHHFGQPEESVPTPRAASLGTDPQFRYGIDLFNHGYYWEAHEAWERLWIASGREGKLADFLKALIKLAAAGVKAREGNLAGVIRHSQRAAELFQLSGNARLVRCAQELAAHPLIDSTFTTEGNPILPIRLRLEDLRVPH